MKEFDLEKAKAGHPVCTRIGNKARIICFDRKNYYSPIVALVESDGTEGICCYDNRGRYNDNGKECSCDLFMGTVKQKRWINIWKSLSGDIVSDGYFYSSKREAKLKAKNRMDDSNLFLYHKTVKVEWEE